MALPFNPIDYIENGEDATGRDPGSSSHDGVANRPLFQLLSNDEYLFGLIGGSLLADGTVPMTGPLTLSGAPTLGLHAATKSYVDANGGGGGGGNVAAFASATVDFPITDGALTLAHSLGAIPQLVTWILVCVDDDNTAGYVIGDEVPFSSISSEEDGTENDITSVASDVDVTLTSLFLTKSFHIAHKTTGTKTNISKAKWNVKVIAYETLSGASVAAPAAQFISADVAVSSLTDETPIEIPHGLGAIPEIIRAVLVRRGAGTDLGYSAGDEVSVTSSRLSAEQTKPVFRVSTDATNLVIIPHTGISGTIDLQNKTTGAVETIDKTKWRLKVYAYETVLETTLMATNLVKYVSDPTAIPSEGNAATFSHALQFRPTEISLMLVADPTAPELGYTASDEVLAECVSQTDGSSAFVVSSTGAEVFVLRSSTSAIFVLHKNTGVKTAIVTSKWKLKVYAYYTIANGSPAEIQTNQIANRAVTNIKIALQTIDPTLILPGTAGWYLRTNDVASSVEWAPVTGSGKAWMFTYPRGAFIYDSEMHVSHLNDYNSKQGFTKFDVNTLVTSPSRQIHSADRSHMNIQVHKWTPDGSVRAVYTCDRGVISYNFTNNTEVIHATNADWFRFKVAFITFTDPTHPTFWMMSSDYEAGDGGNTNNYDLRKIMWNGSAYSMSTVVNAFNFSAITGGNQAAYTAFNNTNMSIVFCAYNFLKNRIYLVPTGNQMLHVFHLKSLNITDGGFGTSGSPFYSNVEYIGARPLVMSAMARPTNLDQERWTLDYDLETGAERGIVICRMGDSRFGSVSYIPWPGI